MSYDFWDTPPPGSSRFAARLRALRCAAGLTSDALAARAGIPLPTYLAFEASRHRLTAAALVKLAGALAVVPELFFDP